MAAQLPCYECRLHLPFFREGKGQPFDLLALHITLQLGLDLGTGKEADFLARQVPGRSDSHRLIYKKSLEIIVNGRREAEAPVGGIDEVRCSGGEHRDLAGLEGLQCVLLILEGRDRELGVRPEHGHCQGLADVMVESSVAPMGVLKGILRFFDIDSTGE